MTPRDYTHLTPDQQRTRRMSWRVLIDIHDPTYHAMMERRGYTLTIADEMCECRTASDFSFRWWFKYETMLSVEETIDKIAGGHHMMCQCKEPLLRVAAGTGWDDGIHWYVYRSVAARSDSEPITVCSGCGVALSDETVKEIDEWA